MSQILSQPVTDFVTNLTKNPKLLILLDFQEIARCDNIYHLPLT
jgi:hypothetical protein